MRRTTICRSSAALLLTVAALLIGAPASPAQDTTQVAPDGGVTFAPLPASHTVERGETLWSIAGLYFGDPLLWPEIYRLNTAVVEDPHWIYPGEVLVFSGAPQVIAQGPGDTAVVVPQGPGAADTVRLVEGADTVVAVVDPFPVDTTPVVVIEEPPPPAIAGHETIFDRPKSRTAEVQDILRAYADQPYRPVRRGEFYQAGFLTENERLPYAEVIGNTARPAITRLTPQSTAGRYDEIAIRPPDDASYHVGDSVLLLRLDRSVEGWGEVVVPLGMARVREVQPRQLLAVVLAQWGRIRNGSLALPLEPFRDPGRVRPLPVQQGLEGGLIAPRDVHPLVASQQFVFVDRGRQEGLVPGDVLEVYEPTSGDPGSASERVLVTLLVVHTRERSATGMIIGVNHPTLVSGTPVRLIKKMPS
jgi:hypothetical protein